ncbi:autotransporter outer membrane beta-barrel domain-containing protein [Alcaligenaceae bacterium]|nr:autotransporter outer membrane beta-barrel domain-containing protein [Alcaligenaceae bacterium]
MRKPTSYPHHRQLLTPVFKPNALSVRLFIALGTAALASSAQADYSCSAGSGNYADSKVCIGDAGKTGNSSDDKKNRDGDAGPELDRTINDNITGTASDYPIYIQRGNAGALTLQSIGGDGSEAGLSGSGGTLSITNNKTITLQGSSNSGTMGSVISAYSAGGNGDQENGDQNSNGGQGGAGGTVTVVNNGVVNLKGTVGPISAGMYGIYAISGGGSGGHQNNAVYNDQYGGAGGSAQTVHVTNNGAVYLGDASEGLKPYQGNISGSAIYADSGGGAGGQFNGNAGNGGEAWISNAKGSDVQAYWDASGGGTVAALNARSIGGIGTDSGGDESDNGGTGGSGNTATVDNDGSVLLSVSGNFTGNGAAIAARSVGEKGGTGPKETSSGGSGGSAGSATITLGADGRITTQGSRLIGLLAQSIGGQGGNGGDGAALAGTGGGGGYGGTAGLVTITADSGALINTNGDFSAAIIGQSVGGGGGTGGDFVAVLGGQGGNGGNGGNANKVAISSGADISTTGLYAYGILGQSIAGSGGAGGIDASAVVGLGGDGAGGGAASTVDITNSGSISTSGDGAHGLMAQSIGGGGGAAGSSVGLISVGGSAQGTTTSSGGTILIDNSQGSIKTNGGAAHGIVAQSIGGGGGSGASSAGVIGVGGSGAAGGNGGTVTVLGLGQIQTQGEFSIGVLGQSIGGGGGDGGSTLTASAGVTLAIGGSAASGSNSAAVCMGNDGSCDSGTMVPGTSKVTTQGDYSMGLVSQSIGGGGGNGGSAVSASVESLVGLRMGGTAGGGGSAGRSLISYNDLTVQTAGAHAIGLLAQSVGGGGGNGGDAHSYEVGVGFSAGVTLGGSGGSGGSANSTQINLNGSHVSTGSDLDTSDPAHYAPDDAFGVVAHTIGGGGGNGGSTTAADVLFAVPTGEGTQLAVSLDSAVGGSGGSGGDACIAGNAGCVTSVSLTNGSSVWTLGDGSHAVVAQSIGGGGGNGGDASLMGVQLGEGDSVSINAQVTVGGSGADGGQGGKAQVSLGDPNSTYVDAPAALNSAPVSAQAPDSSIVTYGDYANGVLAQSIGGGGGNGGVGSSNPYADGTAVTIKVAIGVGGKGGSGSQGGEVDTTLNPDFSINTRGSGSRGIVAQSIGGGGGTSQGGTVAASAGAKGVTGRVNVGVGMTGGEGGDGGKVDAQINGGITTLGDDADGVLLQSIGGGGGLGGSIGGDASSNPILTRIGVYNDNEQRLDGSGVTFELDTSVGGQGGTGGDGGEVDLNFGGHIMTSGDMADGLVAQSIGGGGGTGGTATASGSKVMANVTIGVGGSGGVAGDGGTVTALFDDNHLNHLQTAGYAAYGVLLQSIGGGGGQGGDGSDQAAGFLTLGAADGGNGGAAGNGGTVNAGNSQSFLVLHTYGSDAPALVAQSIGGGGGVGASGNSKTALDPSSLMLAVSVGGKGGAAGDGGAVNVNTGVNDTTLSARSHAIVAQSIGGGGGIGVIGTVDNGSSVALGGRDGASGDGGVVTVNLLPGTDILTQGEGANAVIAQSIGGGGGISGDTATQLQLDPQRWAANASTDSKGSGSSVTVTSNSDSSINTSGNNAFGIVAQSIGGGGGLAGDSAGSFAGSTASGSSDVGHSGPVTVTANGNINISGSGGTAIFAQSAANGALLSDLGNITVTVNAPVTGGSGASGNGVWVAGGYQNQLTISSSGTVSPGTDDGTAIRYTGTGTLNGKPQGSTASAKQLVVVPQAFVAAPASLVVSNSGRVYGDVRCGNGPRAVACDLNNLSGGLLSDAAIYEANVNNAGRLVIGHAGSHDELAIRGDFHLQEGGVLQTQADFAQGFTAHLAVRGNGVLDGQVDVRPTTLLPDRDLTLATFGGQVQGKLTALDSPVIDYDTRLSGHKVLLRAADAHFAAPAMHLSESGDAVARHLQNAWDLGGGSDMATLFASLDMGARDGASTYSDQLQDMSPGLSLAPGMRMHSNISDFSNGMLSCPHFQGNDALTGEQNCVWATITGQHTTQDGSHGLSGLSVDSYLVQTGGQKEIQPHWFLGGSLAYQSVRLKGDDKRVKGTGDLGYLGVVLKHEAGPWTYSGGISAGYGAYSMDRRINIPGMSNGTQASPDVYGTNLRLRIARTFADSNMYVKPYLDIDGYYTHVPGYSESKGAANLKVDSTDQFIFGVSPMVEIGGRLNLDNGAEVRPYLTAGVTLLSKDSYTVGARLQGAPAETGTFNTTLAMDNVIGRVSAGVQITTGHKMDLRLEYTGQFSKHVSSNAGMVKMMMPF